MFRKTDERDSRPPSKIIWIVGGFLILLMCVIAFSGIILGTGDAVGIEEAAPGGPNADPNEDNDMKVEG